VGTYKTRDRVNRENRLWENGCETRGIGKDDCRAA